MLSQMPWQPVSTPTNQVQPLGDPNAGGMSEVLRLILELRENLGSSWVWRLDKIAAFPAIHMLHYPKVII